ncbi:MAG: ferrochelatase [Chloroflexi bacterium]|nr:ferrochelatase [Chloroflexota bacterium]
MTDAQTALKPPADRAVSAYPETDFDAIIVVSFGGPEGVDEVVPFLRNVTEGRNIPEERLKEVGEHYYMLEGVSPINNQNRALIDALQADMAEHGIELPVYFGNRNWHPMLPDTLQQMADDGVKKALAFFTSAYSSYSGCRQYREDIYRAQQQVEGSAPEVLLTRKFYNHPKWIEVNVERIRDALAELGDQEGVHVAFTVHSIPLKMAQGCMYVQQITETMRLIAEELGLNDYDLVYQSRSGPPRVPWLEPDINDHLEAAAERGVKDVVIAPIGFISDHMEVIFDLDTEARQTCDALGMRMARAGTAGTHPVFVSMIRELIEERLGRRDARPTLGDRGPSWDICPVTCCLPGTGEPSPWDA